MKPTKTISYFDENKNGTDYAIGDIHGQYHLLEDQLKQVGFNKSTDRLFCTGDLVDKGKFSYSVANYIYSGWFFSCLGNHDLMTLEHYYNHYDNSKDCHVHNGGVWFLCLTKEEQKEIVIALEELPYMLEIKVKDNKVGVIHAEVPAGDWKYAKGLLSDEFYGNTAKEVALWKRDKIKRWRNQHTGILPVSGIDLVIVGHSTVDVPIKLDNTIYLDTGCGYNQNGKELLPSIIKLTDYL